MHDGIPQMYGSFSESARKIRFLSYLLFLFTNPRRPPSKFRFDLTFRFVVTFRYRYEYISKKSRNQNLCWCNRLQVKIILKVTELKNYIDIMRYI